MYKAPLLSRLQWNFEDIASVPSQTSQYRWEHLMSLVENRLPKSTQLSWPNREFPRYLSPNLLLGLMDYLYMVQSLPEDRFIIVDSPHGLVSTVIWAHYILGLTVHVQNTPDGSVSFGLVGRPQVIIKWSSPSFPTPDFMTPKKHSLNLTTVSLLDADMQVLLRTEPNDEKDANIEGQEWHRLKGYGTTALRRWFITITFVVEDDPIFAETANFALSFAVMLSKVFRRVNFTQEFREREERLDIPRQCNSSTENWRLFDSSSLLFWGIKLDKRKINRHLENLGGKRVEDVAIPTNIEGYLLGSEGYEYKMSRAAVFGYIKRLASWILSFAQIVNIESCADLPLRIDQ